MKTTAVVACIATLAAIFLPFKDASSKSSPYSTSLKTLRIALSDDVQSNETAIEFKKGKSASYQVSDGDAPYVGGGALMIASMTSDDKMMGINFMPEPGEVKEIKLLVNSKASKIVKLSFPDIPLTENITYVLKDNYLKVERLIVKEASYSFAINKGVKESFGAERFSISVQSNIELPEKAPVVLDNTKSINTYPNPVSSDLHFELTGSFEKKLVASVYNLSGNLVKTSSVNPSNLSMDLSQLTNQPYIVVVKAISSDKPLFITKIFKE